MDTKIFNQSIILENEKVKLIPFENERNTELSHIVFDDSIWTYMGMYIRNESELSTYIQNTIRQKERGLSYPFLIIDKATNRIAGSTRYGNINFASQKCEIGWTWYGKEFQGTGLNRTCKYELLKFGFEHAGFRRIQFSADLENIRSQRAIEKLGAKKEGIFRNNYIDSEGNSKDDVYYSILKQEWKGLKTRVFSGFKD